MRIDIDGSMLEGGGQILRLSIALSAVSGVPLRIYNIRAKRSNPGLRPQHLTAIKAVAELVGAKVEGLRVGSRELIFTPGRPRGGRFYFDVGTAGATTLVLQSLLPASAFSPKRVMVEVKGGTNNPMAPPIDYVQRLLLPILAKMNYHCQVSLLRRGFYPRGGGVVRAVMEPVDKLRTISMLKPGKVVKITGIAYSCKLPGHIVERMAKSAEKALTEAGYGDVEIEHEVLQPEHPKCSLDPGCGILLRAETNEGALLGADSLGERGKPAEKVGLEAAQSLIKQLSSGASIDRYMGDQLIVYMALADGKSEVRVSELTLHALTCMEVVKILLGVTVEVEGGLGKTSNILCRGVGLRRKMEES
ncbi:MAG: RNA 3'-phosphate cyclase [Thermoprotei archaeon]|nr:MAG: RNA 3'-phosphate cyclase [Thermoprotei archaeon]